MIVINMKGIAKYLTASETQKRKILRDYKFPNPDGIMQAIYYREALSYIKKFHKGNYAKQWLLDKARDIRDSSSTASGQAKTRLQYNARAIENYAKYFSNKRFVVSKNQTYFLRIFGIRIKISPDMYVKDGKLDKIIKLDFGKNPPHKDMIKAMCQMMYDAAIASGMNISGSQVLYIDVPRGGIYHEARNRSRVKANIEAACQNIAGIWDGIKK